VSEPNQPGEAAQDEAAQNLPARAGEERLSEQVARTGMFGASTTGDTSGYGGLQVRIAPGLSTPRPYGSYFDDVADQLEAVLGEDGTGFGDAIERVVADRGELTFHVRREHLVRVARTLRDTPGLAFELCSGVSGVHYLDHAQPAAAAGGERARRRPARALAGGGLPDLRLARAGDLGLLRHHL
jgi:NADH-quinone oxidoreductase subunit C